MSTTFANVTGGCCQQSTRECTIPLPGEQCINSSKLLFNENYNIIALCIAYSIIHLFLHYTCLGWWRENSFQL